MAVIQIGVGNSRKFSWSPVLAYFVGWKCFLKSLWASYHFCSQVAYLFFVCTCILQQKKDLILLHESNIHLEKDKQSSSIFLWSWLLSFVNYRQKQFIFPWNKLYIKSTKKYESKRYSLFLTKFTKRLFEL